MIAHFDVDKNIWPLLQGKKCMFSLVQKNFKKIPHKDKIQCVTIKTQSHINESILKVFPHLRLIITRTVGIDHVDLDPCKKRKIAVYNIPDYGPQHVAQHAIALLLCGARNIIRANYTTHKGNFSYQNFLGISMSGKILGVIGTGKIGLEVIKISQCLGMKIIAYDIVANQIASQKLCFNYVSLEKLLKEADVVTLHIPSTQKTHHLLNKKTLSYLKKGTILINTSRGDLIDIKALEEIVSKLHVVCLDVVEEESSFSQTHPLLKYNNVIITPHCAFYTDESLKIIAQETMNVIKKFQQGDSTNRLI